MKSGRPLPPLSPQEPSPSRSTYQYLDCVSSNLYRHRVSGVYYGVRKIAGKRRCLSLKAADRKTAERKLAEWLRDLGEVDASNPDVTLATLIENFRAAKGANGLLGSIKARILSSFLDLPALARQKRHSATRFYRRHRL